MSQTGVVSFSQTAATNANADSTQNWAEGMAPSAVNDSARAMMASIAKYRDDISGAIVTGGTSTAYTVTSYQSFSSLSVLANQVIAFTPHTTCGSTVTLNVDSLGAKPLRQSPGVELPAGTIVQGTPYVAVYNASDAAFYLQSFFGNPYSLPIGGVLPFIGATAPNSSFVLAYGQAISRTTYSALFSLVSTTYGTGDGSTTFNIPDLRGRFIAGKDDMGGSAASRLTSTYFGTSAAALGAAGGGQSHTLSLGELPTGITSANGSQSISVTVATPNSRQMAIAPAGDTVSFANSGSGINIVPATVLSGQWTGITSLSGTTSNSISVTSNNTSGSAHAIVPPALVLNYLLRIV